VRARMGAAFGGQGLGTDSWVSAFDIEGARVVDA